MAAINWDELFKTPSVYLDTKDMTQWAFDILLWDRRYGTVNILTHRYLFDADGNGSFSPEHVTRHQSDFIVHCELPDIGQAPSVEDLLRRDAFVMVEKDGHVYHRGSEVTY